MFQNINSNSTKLCQKIVLVSVQVHAVREILDICPELMEFVPDGAQLVISVEVPMSILPIAILTVEGVEVNFCVKI